MIPFMVDLETSPDHAVRDAIIELRAVAAALRADMDQLTGNISSQTAAIEQLKDAEAAAQAPKRSRAKATGTAKKGDA